MNDDAHDELGFGADPLVSAATRHIANLQNRLELQRRIQETVVQSSITPYLAVSDAARAIEFYVGVFGATVVGEPFLDPSGLITHAELNIKGASIYLSDEFLDLGVVGPRTGTGNPVSLVIVVADADLCMEAAVASGAAVERPIQDQWDGRSGWFVDPFGHRWSPTSRTSQLIEEQ